jgi:hypothetical protein
MAKSKNEAVAPITADDAPAAEKKPRRTREKIYGGDVITLLAEENPKRATARERFDLYTSGMTVDEYLEAGGKRYDLGHDEDKGWISIERKGPPAKEEAADEAA